MSTVAVATKKFQIGAATLAVAAAATLTPVAAQAAPSFAPFVEGVGNSAAGVVNSPVIIRAAASASVVGDPCAATPTLACYTVQGFIRGTQDLARALVNYIGTPIYVGLKIAAAAIGIVPLPIFQNLANGVSTIADNFAEALKIGPYLP